MLTGAGMLNSCQQEEIVNEPPASKGVTIRASLPNDAQSRVALDKTNDGTFENDGKTYTKLCWEAGDVIKVTVAEDEYFFTTTENGETTATFTCTQQNVPDKLPCGEYIFTCGSVPAQTQTGTGNGLQMQASCTVEEEGGRAWSNVTLNFSTKVAIVEISLPSNVLNNGESTVSMYDVNTGECKASVTRAFTDQNNVVYFSVVPGSYEPLFKIENGNNTYVKKVSNKTLVANKLYSVTSDNMVSVNPQSSSIGTSISGTTAYIYGTTGIADNAFRDSEFDAITSLVILDGVTSIGEHAFHSSNALQSVIIPGTVTTIKGYAFASCDNLTRVIIYSDRAKIIESNAFWSCNSLTSAGVTFSGSETPTIESGAFSWL